jgi:carboxypeptidase T
MKNSKATLLLLMMAIAIIPALAQQEKYSKVKIYNDSRNAYEQRKFIYNDLQVDHCHFEEGGFVAEIGESEVQKLKASPYQYEILVDDVAANFVRTNDISKFYDSDRQYASTAQSRGKFAETCKQVASIIPTPTMFVPGSMGGYYTYSQMDSIMTVLETNHPTLFDKFSIGTSIEGRTIWAVKISDNVNLDENEPEVSFNALQHCREAISGTSLIFFMEYLMQFYNGATPDPKVVQLVNNREIFIIPCMNPDGYVYNQTTNPGGGGNWRKNRRPLGGGEFGVDLNRNYNADWGNCSSPTPLGTVASCGNGAATSANNTYWGTAPFSEPETQAFRDFVAAHNFRMSIDQHSEGAYNTVPHGRFSAHMTHNLIDSQFLYGFSSSNMAAYNCHRIGNNYQTLNYEVAGGNKDWLFQGDTSMTVNPRKIYAFTSEAGGGSFWPTAVNIIPLAKGLTYQYLEATLAAGSYADIQDMNDLILPLSDNGTLDFRVTRTGILDAPITVSLIPLQNMTAVGPPVNIPTIPVYNTTVNGSISYTVPGALLTGGQPVKFIWRVTTDGITTDDTITKYYDPTNIFYDDMETGAVGTSWAATGGWAYTTNGAPIAGTRTVAESPAGNYANGTRNLTCNTTINLVDAKSAFLTFWVKHRTETCQDNLRIQLSTNGGTTFPINLCGRYTIAENGGTLGGQPALTGIRENWTREMVDLTPYTGAGMNNLRIRFSFTASNVGGDLYYRLQDDGFYLDNVRIAKTTANLLTLPVHFISFDGKLLPNGNAELKWEAEVDNMHDRFEIERSNDRVIFTKLGTETRIITGEPYKFIDAGIQKGRNYYRIKQIDKDGMITYSKIINLYVDPGKISIAVYPNPTSGVLKVSFSGDAGELYTLTVTDLLGKKIHEENVITGSSSRVVDVNLPAKASQVYVLTVRNAKNEVITTEKIIKH